MARLVEKSPKRMKLLIACCLELEKRQFLKLLAKLWTFLVPEQRFLAKLSKVDGTLLKLQNFGLEFRLLDETVTDAAVVVAG